MVTPEELKDLSPEQIAQLQKENCVFCHIVDGRVASKKVYEDDKVLAVLDINPANPGHMLLLPKEHYLIMPQLPDDVTGHTFMVAKALSQSTLRALKAKGNTILIANGAAAGQRAPHFMIHVIPRAEGDGISFTLPEKTISKDEHEKLKKLIIQKLNSVMGIKKEEPIILDKEAEKIKAGEVEAEFEEVEEKREEKKEIEKKEKEEKEKKGEKAKEQKKKEKMKSEKKKKPEKKKGLDDLLR